MAKSGYVPGSRSHCPVCERKRHKLGICRPCQRGLEKWREAFGLNRNRNQDIFFEDDARRMRIAVYAYYAERKIPIRYLIVESKVW